MVIAAAPEGGRHFYDLRYDEYAAPVCEPLPDGALLQCGFVYDGDAAQAPNGAGLAAIINTK